MNCFKNASIALIVSLVVLVPSAGWAGSCCSEQAKSHMHGGMRHQKGESQMHGASHQGSMRNEKCQAVMDEIYGNYFAIGTALAEDSLEGVAEKAEAIAEAADGSHAIHHTEMAGQHDVEAEHVMTADIAEAARSLAKADDLASARAEYVKLSRHLHQHYSKSGKEYIGKVHVYRCDMAKEIWLQKDDKLGNPYFGRKMAACRRELEQEDEQAGHEH